MKKNIHTDFISIVLVITLLLSFSVVPVFAAKPSGKPSDQPSDYTQINNTDSAWIGTKDSAHTLVNDYDVVVVKQATFLVVWTRTAASSALQTEIKSQIINVNGLGAMNIDHTIFFNGYTQCTTPDWADPNFGKYWVTKDEKGQEYFYATKISHFIVKPAETIAPTNSALIQATKVIEGTPSVIPSFQFSLKDSGTTVGNASISNSGTVTFTLDSGFTLPGGGATKALTMAETHPDPIPTNWTYSNASYTVIIYSDGSVSYENGGTPLTVLPAFENIYSKSSTGGTSSSSDTSSTGSTSSDSGTSSTGGTNSTGGTTSSSGTGSTGGTTSSGTSSTGGTSSDNGTSSIGSTSSDSGTSSTGGTSNANVSSTPNHSSGSTSNTQNTESIPDPTIPKSAPSKPESVPDDAVPHSGPAIPDKKPQHNEEVIGEEKTPLASPKTGDTSNLNDLFILLGFGAIGFTVSEIMKRRESFHK